MTTIRSILERDLGKKIEEIIKLDQIDEQSVYDEMSEYVVTAPIREEYRTLLTAMAEAPEDPHEGVGVWISGFFGSGKSSFAKNLGYLLANRTVCGKKTADVMKRQSELLLGFHDGEAFGDGLHHAVLDTVVHHLDEVSRAMFPNPTPTRIRAGRERFKDRAMMLHHRFVAADHHAIAFGDAPDAAARADIQEV